VDEKRAQAMESAFTETFRDSDFLKDAEKAKIEIRPLRGMKTGSLVTQVLQTPADLKIKLKNILHKS